jgi:hypothetical protein
MHYHCYNLTIASEIVLPELLSAPIESRQEDVDVHIRVGSVPEDGLWQGQQIRPFLWMRGRDFLLQVPAIARYLVLDGKEIIVDPEPGIDEDSIRLFLLGSAFGGLLLQRGLLVMHGNAIRVGDRCMVCIGQAGAGKSTLAAGFMQRGYPVISDDVVPVDSHCRALPGFPRIKLWQDAADKLLIETGDLRRICPEMEKFHFPVASQNSPPPLPIRWVYILGKGAVETVEIEPIHGMRRFQQLYDNNYRLRLLHGMALGPDTLKLCGALAGRVRLASVTRPQDGFTVDPIIDALLADMAENP